jgi:hypothetical protein
LRYPREIDGRISSFDKLSEIFDGTTKFVKLENPRIEVRDAREDASQVEEENFESWFGIRSRLMEATYGKM